MTFYTLKSPTNFTNELKIYNNHSLVLHNQWDCIVLRFNGIQSNTFQSLITNSFHCVTVSYFASVGSRCWWLHYLTEGSVVYWTGLVLSFSVNFLLDVLSKSVLSKLSETVN